MRRARWSSTGTDRRAVVAANNARDGRVAGSAAGLPPLLKGRTAQNVRVSTYKSKDRRRSSLRDSRPGLRAVGSDL